MYNSLPEQSYYVYPFTYESFKLVLTLARTHDQESILYVGGDGAAYIVYTCDDLDTEYIGTIKEVSMAVACTSDGYTEVYDKTARRFRYFIIEED
jgi:hypothetical protein